MRLLPSLCFGLTLLALPLTTRANQAQDILRQAARVYQNVQTFQCEIITRENGVDKQHKPFTLTRTQVLRFARPGKLSEVSSWAGTGSKMVATGQREITISDGSSFYQYNFRRNSYMKQPLPAAFRNLTLDKILLRYDPAVPFNARLLKTTKIDGRDAYIVEADVPITAAPKANTITTRFSIDKQNYRLMRVAIGRIFADYTQQKFNVKLPANEFVFTPPKGAQQIQPRTPSGAGAQNAPGKGR